jgi:exodeoxyribonuclease VII small subunit
MAEKKFEAALSRLEDIVKELEGGELPLEQSLKLFEEGIKLSRICNKRLEDAERRVEILRKGKDGSISAEPFEENEEE